MGLESIQAALIFSENARKKAIAAANAYSDTALAAAIAALPKALVYKGAVNYYADLPTEGVEVGHCYTVLYQGTSGTKKDGTEYAWGEYDGLMQWIALGPNIMNKADKIPDGTIGNIVTVGADGNPVDSGKTFDNFLTDFDKGRPNGVASLTQEGVVPPSQLPVSCHTQNMELRIFTEIV